MVCGSTEQSYPDGTSSKTKKRKAGSSKTKQDLKKEKRLNTLIKNAKVFVNDAKALGADVSTAMDFIRKAEKSLKTLDLKDVPLLVRTARAEATEAKRQFRAERMIRNVLPLVDQADELEADITEPLQFLREAQNSLQLKNFGMVSQNVKNVRNAVARSKNRKRIQNLLDRTANVISKSEKEGLDVEKAQELQTRAEIAFAEEKHIEVQKISLKIKRALKDAKLKKKMEDKLQSVRLDLEELKSLGVDTTLGEEILENARQAMEEGKYSKMQNLIQRNRRWITRERKKRETEVLVNVMGTLLDKASQGEDELLDAKELLKSFKTAIMTDKISALQDIMKRDLDDIETEERRKRSSRRFLRLKSLVRDVAESGEDTTGYEIVIREIQRAFDQDEIDKADALMEEIEKNESILRLSRKRAEYLLNKAKSSLMQAQNMDMNVSEAEQLLIVAENLLSEENFIESMEKAKSVYQIAEDIMPEDAIAKKREMEKRLTSARMMLDEARRASIDVSDADQSLEEAEKATEEGRLREAERLIVQAEKLGEELSSSLEDASAEFISLVRSSIEKLKAVGVTLPQVETLCQTAETYHNEGKYQVSIESAKMAQNLMKEHEKTIEMAARENVGALRKGIEKVKATGAHVEEAEFLIEDASVAIDEKDFTRYELLVEKAEGSLRDAETIYMSNRALRELEDIQELIKEAKSIGAGLVDEAEIVVRKAEEAYETKNYGIVSMLADTAKEMLGESQKRKLIREYISRSKAIFQVIEEADKAGMDAEQVRQLFRRAQESFGEDDYESALKFVRQSEKVAQGRIEEYLKDRFPKVLVNLPAGAIQSGIWNKYIFELVNEGDITAEDIRIDLKGDFEVKGLKTLASLLPNEKKKMEVGLKPRHDGNVPVDVSISYKKPLDQTKFEVRTDADMNISRLGTYLVDDVFLVHNDGRLILHETREFKEDVDEDIFSGMLTVMQEFVRDSFGTRATTGLSRMDFGDNKVVIERGNFVYLATILTGDEPALLPLYMAEIVKEVEEKYMDALDDWSGLLSELEGVNDIVRRLIFVSDDEDAEIGELEASMITATLEMMRDAQSVGADVSQAQDLLHKAKQLLEDQDYESAWRCVEEAAENASKSKARLRGQIENALISAQTAVDEARDLGLEVEKAESLLENAEEAVDDLDVDEVNSIVDKVNEVLKVARTRNLELAVSDELDKARGVLERLRQKGIPVDEAEVLAREATEARLKEDFESAERYLQMFKETVRSAEKTVELDAVSSRLTEFRFITQNAKELGLDVSEIEKRLQEAEEAREKGRQEAFEESLKEVGELLEDVRGLLKASEIDQYLDSVRGMVERAKSLGIEVNEAEGILSDAAQLDSDDVEKLRNLIGNAEQSASGMIADYVRTRSPDIKLRLPEKGLQADVWNKYVFEIANEGNIAARNIEVDLSGEFEVKGLENIPHIDAKEKKEVEVGLKPAREGETSIDAKVYYQKYFDEEQYSLDDLRKVRVESQGTYLVEDVFLIHRDGRLIAHESRKYRDEIDEDVFSGMLSVVQDFVKDSFQSKDNVGLKRLDFGESKILMERGRHVSVATVLVGQEPILLPLHILEVIANIEEQYGEVLEGWVGLMSDLAGIDEFIKELIFVTDKQEALSEGLESSYVAATFGVEGAHQIIEEARKVVETEPLDSAWDFVSELGSVVVPDETKVEMAYPETKLSPEFMKDLGDLAENPEFRVHIATISEIVHNVAQARVDLDMGERAPISLVAIKPNDQESAEVISDFKRVLRDHLRAKELVVVTPGQEWEGLDLEIIVNDDKLAETYPHWNRKIKMLLRSQSPWKIKSGLDKGSYSLGIEGQTVLIDSSMVSYEISVPEHVAEYDLGWGKIFIDTTQTDELKAEWFAGEIIEEITRTKEEAGMQEDNPVELKICIGEELKTLLEDWMDDIITEVRCTSFKFRPPDWSGDAEAHSVSLTLGHDNVTIYMKQAAEA